MSKTLITRIKNQLTPIVLVGLVLAVSLYDPRFLPVSNLLTVAADTMTLFLMASGVTLVIMMGGIDLSIQSVAWMASCILAANLARFGFGAVVLAVLGGLLAGWPAASPRRCSASPHSSPRWPSAGSSPRWPTTSPTPIR